MNIWYLHGLESEMGGPKVDFLFTVADKVYAPYMNYSRSIETEGVTYGESNWKRNFVVGTEDTVIDPKATLVYKDIAKSYTEIKGMGHRTSLNVFTDIYTKWSTNQL